MSATIRDLAREAGVSIGTISRVLNNKEGVSEEVRTRVLAAAEELGYRPMTRSTMPQPHKLKRLGFLIRPTGDTLTGNPFYSRILYGVEQECRLQHVSLLYAVLDISGDQLGRLPRMLTEREIDGILWVGMLPKPVREKLLAAGDFPVVLVDHVVPELPFDTVNSDNEQGGRLATEYLIGRRHRAIALISGPHRYSSSIDREIGYIKTMQAHGLEPRVQANEHDLGELDGAREIQRLMERYPDTTAVFCGNDAVAIGAMTYLQQHGVRVPDDISFVGFDNNDLATRIRPALTTIHSEAEWLGRIAVRTLAQRVHDPALPTVHIDMGVHLVERDSVRRL